MQQQKKAHLQTSTETKPTYAPHIQSKNREKRRNFSGRNRIHPPHWRAVRYAILNDHVPFLTGVPSGTQHIEWSASPAISGILQIDVP